MLNFTKLTLLVTATTTALMAGLFFAWSFSVTLGLARLSNTEYISAMQSMNRAIQNPVFFICFLGTVVLLPLSTYLHYEGSVSARFWFLLFAAFIYFVAVFGVTIFGNVPLNEMLDAFRLETASDEEISSIRAKFEEPWNALNMVRTVASTIAIVLVIIACLKPWPE